MEYYPAVSYTSSIDYGCPCDHIHPVHYLENLSDSPNINYVRGHLSELGFLTNSPYDDTIDFASEDGAKFNEFADKIYGEGYVIHRRWALFVKKTDEGFNVPWGMEHGVGLNPTAPVKNWATCVYDGLLNTRLYDSSSIQNNIWFSPGGFGFDENAYDRWVSINNPQWPDGTNQNNIENFADEFQSAYESLWNQENDGTAMGLLKEVNGDSPSTYDWYIPSLVELNHIYANQGSIPSGIDGWNSLSGTYWTSTSGLVDAHNLTQPEDFNLDRDYQTSTWSSEQKYRAGSSLHAYVQDFTDGSVSSERKKNGSANVRLVKRIPIYV
jgi:hypothetical protein